MYTRDYRSVSDKKTANFVNAGHPESWLHQKQVLKWVTTLFGTPAQPLIKVGGVIGESLLRPRDRS